MIAVGPAGPTDQIPTLGAPDLSTPLIPGTASLDHQISIGDVRHGGGSLSPTPDLVLVCARSTACLVALVCHIVDVPDTGGS